MNELLFIRHAATDMAGTFCGHADPPVNAAGQEQVQILVEALRHRVFDAVYTSDLRRAITTAEALSRRYFLPLIQRPALREIGFGAWEGLSWSAIERVDAAYASEWLAAYPRLPAPDGEDFADFESRVFAELTFLAEQRQHARIAVVTHRGVMRSILTMTMGCNEQEALDQTSAYCSMFQYAADERWLQA